MIVFATKISKYFLLKKNNRNFTKRKRRPPIQLSCRLIAFFWSSKISVWLWLMLWYSHNPKKLSQWHTAGTGSTCIVVCRAMPCHTYMAEFVFSFISFRWNECISLYPAHSVSLVHTQTRYGRCGHSIYTRHLCVYPTHVYYSWFS